MSHISIYVHMVWATKDRSPVLIAPHRYKLFDHIRENAKSKHIHLDHINGHLDHVHCLISLSADQSIAKIAQLLKGESSFWANNKSEGLFPSKLKWADDYYAAAIGIGSLDQVRAYIRNQEKHHKHKSFDQECMEFEKNYGFDRNLGW